MKRLVLLVVTLAFTNTLAEEMAAPAVPFDQQVKPYRTFVTVQRYNLENNGTPGKMASNVRVEVTFPNGSPKGVTLELPEGGDSWPVGNGQSQEINRTFEIPHAFLQADGFNMRVQMHEQGRIIDPCEISVQQLSQFNRAYNCQTDVAAQLKGNTAPDRVVKAGIQLRVFTDRNSEKKEIPQNAIAIR
jgi:hypothetical protein